MFILKEKSQLEKAIAKAKQIRPVVKFDHFGRYRVSGSKGGYYTVICKRSDNNYRTVECTCKGGKKALSAITPQLLWLFILDLLDSVQSNKRKA